MNNRSQEDAGNGCFVLKKDDVPNIFTQTNPTVNSQMLAATIPAVMRSAPVPPPGISGEDVTPSFFDMNARNQGFAEAERGSPWSDVHSNMSAVGFAPTINTAPPSTRNPLPAVPQKSINPYADYLEQMQQANGMVNASMQEDITVYPNPLQNGNQLYHSTAMITHHGFAPNALHTISP